MKRIYKTETLWLVLPLLFLMAIITPGTVWSVEDEQVSVGPINTALAVMSTGQSKTYTVESDAFPDLMIISLIVYGNGTLNVSVNKTDTGGELIGVMQLGGYSTIHQGQQYGATIGVTPCTIVINARFWDYGFGIVMSGLLSSLEAGPHRFTVTLSYN